jgi:membrane-associated phospholipid phosphatase
MAFLTRYVDDQTRPTVGQAVRDAVVRAVLPAIVLWLVIVGIGKLIDGPLGGLQSESSVNRALQAGRSATWDTITMVWSRIGNTEIIIGTCVLMVALIWWLTRQWWVAVIPAIAISLQATVFVIATAVTGRDRPEVEHLDPAPPTSSYPSGHVGAATALYLTLAAMCQRIPNRGLRWVLTVLCLVIPLLVGYARLYRGMHHFTDVLVGFLNGIVCAVLAWGYLRRNGVSDGSGANQTLAYRARAKE